MSAKLLSRSFMKIGLKKKPKDETLESGDPVIAPLDAASIQRRRKPAPMQQSTILTDTGLGGY